MFDNLDDPKRMFLLALGAQIAASRGNLGQAVGQGLLGGMQAYQSGKALNDKSAEEAQQRELRQGAIDDAKRQRGLLDSIGGAAKRAYAPAQTMQPDPYEYDQMGQETPQPQPFNRPAGGGDPAFVQDLMQLAPMQGFGLRQQMQKDMPHPSVSAKDYTPASVARFAVSRNYADLVPVTENKIAPNGAVYDPQKVTPGQNFGALSYHDMGGYISVRDASGNEIQRNPKTRTPDSVASEGKPQVITGTNGEVFTVDPRKGTGAVVTGADGQPLNKGGKALTESQAKGAMYLGMMDDAEAVIKASKFDPGTIKNQTLIAFARGDLPKLPTSVQNVFAGKDAQQYTQASLQWSEAMLRQLTGANAPDTEVKRNAATYFPMPGDSKEVIVQKNAARKNMTDYIRIVAAHGAGAVDAARGARQQRDDPLGIR